MKKFLISLFFMFFVIVLAQQSLAICESCTGGAHTSCEYDKDCKAQDATYHRYYCCCGFSVDKGYKHNFSYSSSKHQETCSECGYAKKHTATWKYYNGTYEICDYGQCTIKRKHSFDRSSATCTKDKKCKNCDYVAQEKLGHSYDPSSATCTEDKKCTRCGYVDEKALGHTGGTATCTEKPKCTRCGERYGSALGHTGGKATCIRERECTRCGGLYGSIDPDGHNFSLICEKEY